MRELLLVAIMIILVPASLVRPKIGLLGYTWFALLRPDYLAWAAGEYPFSLVLAICTLLGAVPDYLGKIDIWFRDGICQASLLLTVLMGVSVVGAIEVPEAWPPYSLFLRVMLMAALIPLMIRTFEDFRLLMLVIAFSMGFLGFRFGFYGLIRGGARFDSGYGGFLADNNCVALALVMVVPLCWYAFQKYSSSKWMRWVFLVMTFGSCAGVVWTHSRGGALALGATLLVLILRSNRRLLALGGILILSMPAVWMAKDTYMDRLASLSDYEQEASAASRLELAKGAVKVWLDHPLFGVGFGSTNFQKVIGQYIEREDNHVAHNTYLQIAADSGTPALLVYVLILLGVIIRLGMSARRLKQRGLTELTSYPAGLQASLIGFALGSAFLSRVTFDFYYILIMTASSWFIVERTILTEAAALNAAAAQGAVQDHVAGQSQLQFPPTQLVR